MPASRPLTKRTRREKYKRDADGIYLLAGKRGKESEVALTNFSARIVNETVVTDGAESQLFFELEVLLYGQISRHRVPASQFEHLTWVHDQLGANAVIYPVHGARQHLPVAICLLSGSIPRTCVYRHLGWVWRDHRRIFLSNGGAIGADGAVADVDVQVPGTLSKFSLPPPPNGTLLRRHVLAALRFLDAAADEVSVPLLASALRAPLGPVGFTVFLVGSTGTGKTSIATVAQQFFGRGIRDDHLPCTWISTSNHNEEVLFLAKDTLTLVDDYVPATSLNEVQRQNRDADRLLRSQGNRAGRGRMGRDGSLRAARPPRSSIVATGEDMPGGQSLRARSLVVEVRPNSTNWTVLTECQQEAATGAYASVMSALISWLASRLNRTRKSVTRIASEFVASAPLAGVHRRTPAILTELLAGIEAFCSFAADSGAMGAEEVEGFRDRCRTALVAVAGAQRGSQASSNQELRFVQLVESAMLSGQAHLDPLPDCANCRRTSIGWADDGNGWVAKGAKIGWIDDEGAYLLFDAALQVAQRIGRDHGASITLTRDTLALRLHEAGLLGSIEVRGDGNRYQVRRKIEGNRVRVLHLALSAFEGTKQKHAASTASPAPTAPTAPSTVKHSS
jgi:hypothetical protein